VSPSPLDARTGRALVSLDGLSVGDAWGEQFTGPGADDRVAARRWPAGPWRYTDDTDMALALTEVLASGGEVDESQLARAFVRRFVADPERGYGAGTAGLLQQLRRGAAWSEASRAVFGGAGSCGNGGAMRAAPVGAYFADDLARVAAEAARSAVVTHAHPDGIAGAVAVALAAALVWQTRHEPAEQAGVGLLEAVIARCPSGDTRQGLVRAAALGAVSPTEAAARLGSGLRLLAADTVPFALWCARWHLDDFGEALWSAVSAPGDRDTLCAITGGILALRTPPPPRWREGREPLRFESSRLVPPSGQLQRWRERGEQLLWWLASGRRGLRQRG
jgi:ADP-ribosylglycohydrolase